MSEPACDCDLFDDGRSCAACETPMQITLSSGAPWVPGTQDSTRLLVLAPCECPGDPAPCDLAAELHGEESVCTCCSACRQACAENI